MTKPTENTLMVRPINKELLQDHIREAMFNTMDYETESLHIRTGALAGNSLIIADQDCIGYFMEQRTFYDFGRFNVNCDVDYICDIPVRIRVKTKDGETCPMLPSYYFPIAKSILEKSYLLPPITLKEFMGERYNYNPRITKNMKGLLSNQQLIDELQQKERHEK